MIPRLLREANRLSRALFGLATQRTLIDYAAIVGLMLFILLMVAWTIDLASQAGTLRRTAAERGASFAAIALPYLGYRTVDMVTRLLPMACFFGVFIAEIRRRVSLETVVLAAAGASTARLMIGGLWLGLLLGVLLQGLEGRWRPAAVWAQIEFGVGGYAQRFGQGWLGAPRWILTEDLAVRGEIFRGEAPEMRNVQIFSGIREPELRHILSGTRLTPTETPFVWLLEGATRWTKGQTQGTAVPDRRMRIDILPEALQFYGVLEFNLRTDDLRAFDALPPDVPRPGVDMALWRRWTAWMVPGALIVLGAVLARAGFDGRRPVVPRLIGLAALGYTLVVSIKVFWKLGEHAALAAPLAAVAGVGLALLAASLVARLRW